MNDTNILLLVPESDEVDEKSSAAGGAAGAAAMALAPPVNDKSRYKLEDFELMTTLGASKRIMKSRMHFIATTHLQTVNIIH